MDLLASLLFGAAAIKAIEGKGVTDQKELTSLCIKAGFIAAGCLGAIYAALAYTGATSVSIISGATNGGQMLKIHSPLITLAALAKSFWQPSSSLPASPPALVSTTAHLLLL